MTRDGSSGRKKEIRAYAAETGRSYADAARALAAERRSEPAAPGSTVWIDVRSPGGTASMTIRADQITAVRVAGPLSPESLRRLPPEAARLPYVLQVQVSGSAWHTLARGASERFQDRAATDLLAALAEHARGGPRSEAMIGSLRDEDGDGDGDGTILIDWR